MTEPTPVLCVLCPPTRARVARDGGVTDWLCHDRLESSLGEIVQRYARLSARPGGGQDFGRRAPGYASRPPANLHIAALRDPRTAPAELGDAHSPLNLVVSWASWMRRVRSQPPVAYTTLDDLAVLDFEWRYLTTSMDWVTRQSWVVAFNEQVRAVVSQLRTATGDPNPRPVATCECGHALFPPRPGTLTIVCGGCNRLYEPLDQIRAVHEAKLRCAGCGHASAQHSNDEAERGCNVKWCVCTAYVVDEPTREDKPA